MKKLFFFFFLFIGIVCNAQRRIQFQYDSAGNQISRIVCVSGCTAKNANEVYKDAKTLTEQDMIQDVEFEQLSYYPNPVLEELYVKWKNGSSVVSHIELYNLNGQLIKSIPNLENTETVTISFLSLPEGFYSLVLNYTNGATKNLKIVKNQN